MTKAADPRIIIALDEPDLERARAIVAELGENAIFYKIGLTLLAQGGHSLCQALKDQGKFIFQDWKLHDIGAQVEGATRAAASGACDLLTVHAEPQVMRAAVLGRGSSATKLLGVTVMTSLSQADLDAMGYGMALEDLVMHRVDQAIECGMDGVVASPHEAKTIRARVPKDFLIVTPGVRPMGSATNDQHRIATPKDALDQGASHLVIGRPVTLAKSPREALAAIIESL